LSSFVFSFKIHYIVKSLPPPLEGAEKVHREVDIMEHTYELMFILDPDLEEEARKSVIERVKNEIKGEVLNVEEWEKRKLAYKINHKEEGYYVVMLFRTVGDTLKELDQFLKLQGEILRHIIVKKAS